jgi:glutamate-1-semialdehyde aminotransferase
MSSAVAAVFDNLDSLIVADRSCLWHPWSPVVSRRERLVMASAQGCWVSDARGRTYLDLRAGMLYAAVGYGHPQVVEAIARHPDTPRSPPHAALTVAPGVAHFVCQMPGADFFDEAGRRRVLDACAVVRVARSARS